MLVTFSTEAYADISMFGEVAQRLLKLMGNSATIPGAILADDVPSALSKLQSGLDAGAGGEEMAHGQVDVDADDTQAQSVNLRKRALPLLALLEAAGKAHENVMWK